MDSMDLLNDTQNSCADYSVYSQAPSEADVELLSCATALSSMSDFDVNEVSEAIKTAVGNEGMGVVTAISLLHDLQLSDVLENGEYSTYSPAPSEVGVELASGNEFEEFSTYSPAPSEADVHLGETDNFDSPEEDVLTALSIINDAPESIVSTANSIADVETANSFQDQASIYVAKPSTTLVEIEGDLIGQASSPVLTAVSGSFSWYSSPPSEADCELPFTIKMGNATVVDSNEVLYLKNVELKPVQFDGANDDGQEMQENRPTMLSQ